MLDGYRTLELLYPFDGLKLLCPLRFTGMEAQPCGKSIKSSEVSDPSSHYYSVAVYVTVVCAPNLYTIR